MKKKEFIEHYNNILNCPSIGKYPEKEDYLKNEIQQLADIDKISYQLALDKIYSVFYRQYLEADPDDNEIETATVNLLFLRCLEGKEHQDEKQD